MKRWITGLFLMTVVAILPLPGQDKTPTIAFDSQAKDFGKVMEGEVLKHVFKFTNKGQATLEILKVEPG